MVALRRSLVDSVEETKNQLLPATNTFNLPATNAPAAEALTLSPNPNTIGVHAFSDHTFLSADGARVSFVTAKQTEAEIQAYNEAQQ